MVTIRVVFKTQQVIVINLYVYTNTYMAAITTEQKRCHEIEEKCEEGLGERGYVIETISKLELKCLLHAPNTHRSVKAQIQRRYILTYYSTLSTILQSCQQT